MTKVGVFGASGRVGRLVVENLLSDSEAHVESVHVEAELDFPLPSGVMVTNDYKTFLDASDVIIDFSAPVGVEKLLQTALENGCNKPIVIGTTGLDEHQKNLMKEASGKMPILYATNMSMGIAVLNRLVLMASKVLNDFDCEIVEMHHRFKKDAPSGTALTLAEYAAEARGLELSDVRVSGRNGIIGERTDNEIAVMSLRGGDIAGRHTAGFYNEGEYIELSHTATSRHTFAKGAIRAAKWLSKQQPGYYSIYDCLGI